MATKRLSFACSKDYDQHEHLASLVRLFAAHSFGSYGLFNSTVDQIGAQAHLSLLDARYFVG